MENRYWVIGKTKKGNPILPWPIFNNQQKAIDYAKELLKGEEVEEVEVQNIFKIETIWKSENKTIIELEDYEEKQIEIENFWKSENQGNKK